MKEKTRSFYQEAVERAALRITRMLDEALDLAALAREAALSPFHFHRVFRGMLGETPLEMHRRLRLERAAGQLLNSDVPVTTIAFDAGYETHEAFTRSFRQAYGAPPSVFRQGAAAPRSGCARPPQIELAAPAAIHFGREITTLQFAGGEPTMDVTIENMSAFRVAAVRHIGPYPQISNAFAHLGQLAGPAGLIGRPDAMMLAIYYDDPESTPASELRSDAGITVAEDARLPDGLVEQQILAGRYARFTHVGPYTELPDVWARFMGQWLPRSGYRVGAGSSFEVYRNTPENTRPEELRTDLYLSLA